MYILVKVKGGYLATYINRGNVKRKKKNAIQEIPKPDLLSPTEKIMMPTSHMMTSLHFSFKLKLMKGTCE